MSRSSSNPPRPRSEILQPGGRLIAALEALLVGLGGYVAIPVLFYAAGAEVDPRFSSAATLVALMLVESVFTLGLIVLFLNSSGKKMEAIGWKFKSFAKDAWIGVASVPLLFLATAVVKSLFESFLPEWVSVENPLLELVDTPYDLILFLASSLFVGGIKEESQRAFILLKFESGLGGIYLGLVVWSVLFGIGHLAQGVDNAVGAGVLGMGFGLLFIWRRVLVAPMLAHTIYNAGTLIFWYTFRPLS